ncbi:MAG: hypothetical protein M1395_01460 [Bacteroidetes bacterium]|nr:hypothetical protein [Bacteroidota bacterium]
MTLSLLQTAIQDSSSVKILSFTDRLDFTLPIIAILVIVAFFFELKSYTMKISPDRNSRTGTKRVDR